MSKEIENERIFYPALYFPGPGRVEALEQPSDIIHHILKCDKSSGLSKLAFNNLNAKKRADRTLIVDQSTLVMAVDGVSHRKQTPARASYGVHFAKESFHNMSAFLPATCPQTKEAAILRGTAAALNHILEDDDLVDLEEDEFGNGWSTTLKKIAIITDSLYMVKCLTDYVDIWVDNGYKDSQGNYVENSQEIADLNGMVSTFERLEIEVRFWLVGSSYNKDANKLAHEAVEGGEKQENGKSLDTERLVTILDDEGLDTKQLNTVLREDAGMARVDDFLTPDYLESLAKLNLSPHN